MRGQRLDALTQLFLAPCALVVLRLYLNRHRIGLIGCSRVALGKRPVVAQADEGVDDPGRQVLAQHDGFRMRSALRARDGDQRLVVQAGGGGEEGSGNGDRLAGDEEGDGRRHCPGLRQRGHGMPPGFLAGGAEEWAEKLCELPELGAGGTRNALETRYSGNQHHVLPAHGQRPFKISKLVRHRPNSRLRNTKLVAAPSGTTAAGRRRRREEHPRPACPRQPAQATWMVNQMVTSHG